MRRGFPLAAVLLLGLLPGCMAVKATTKTAKLVGKTSVAVVKGTAKVITWPVREAMKMSKASQEPPKEPATVVRHGDGDGESKSTRTASKSDDDKTKIDGNIKLASKTNDEEDGELDAPPSRRARKTASKPKSEEDEDADLDEPPKTKSRRAAPSEPSEDEELDEPPRASKSNEKANWRGKGPTRSASTSSSDPDTIRIE